MANELKIMAPVNSYPSAIAQIEAGADEIYLGVNTSEMNNLTFTGRGRSCNLSSFEELQKILDLAHSQGVKVAYTANTPHLADTLEDSYIKYIQRGVDLGVDFIIVATYGNLLLLKEMDLKVPIIASTFFDTYNVEQVKFLRELGVSRVILPWHITIPEIIQMKVPGVEFEVFANFGCSNINGKCRFIHSWDEDVNLGIPCRGRYKVILEDGKEKIINIFDTGCDCSLCNLEELINAGVKYLKIVDRCADYRIISLFTKGYKKCIEYIKEGLSNEKAKERIIAEMPWMGWACIQKRCRFLETPRTNSFI